jgi:hypothetical protein
VTVPSGELPQIVAYDNDGLLGDYIHIFGNVTELFDEENFKGTRMAELGPGVYLHVKDHGIKDNSISSVRLVSPRGW